MPEAYDTERLMKAYRLLALRAYHNDSGRLEADLQRLLEDEPESLND